VSRGERGARAHSQRNWTGLFEEQKTLFTEATGSTQQQSSKKGQAGNQRSGQAGRSGIHRAQDIIKDNNPAGEEAETGTIYRGRNRCTA